MQNQNDATNDINICPDGTITLMSDDSGGFSYKIKNDGEWISLNIPTDWTYERDFRPTNPKKCYE